MKYIIVGNNNKIIIKSIERTDKKNHKTLKINPFFFMIT